MPTEEELELAAAVAKVLQSTSRKKLVVAGPGAGKTTLFRELLKQAPGGVADRLVLTFINNLKIDLDRSLGDLATTFTLHGYCQFLLRRSAAVRGGLTADFVCHPQLAGLIKQDWGWLNDARPPTFVDAMRELRLSGELEAFYLARADYYDAVDFDDSVYRVARQLADHPDTIPAYELVLVDEFQDFNRMEARVIDLLSQVSAIVVAGDDDQALYSKLRSASWEHIRTHHVAGEYEVFNLPFCMRCPEVIVNAVNDVIARARALTKLGGRIDKPFRYFPLLKGEDSQLNPHIDLARTSVQSAGVNYFGRYVEQLIRAVPEADFQIAAEKHEPCVLVIGTKPYLPQVEAYLVQAGLITANDRERRDERTEGLEMLQANPNSNLGWRIFIGSGDQVLAREYVRAATAQGLPLADVLSEEFKTEVLSEAAAHAARAVQETEAEEAEDDQPPRILLTSYEGSKGLSAQHVVLVGLHDGDLPRRPAAIADIEICKFLVGLTRTKKKCTVLATGRFAGIPKSPSTFLNWIQAGRWRRINVNAAYWR